MHWARQLITVLNETGLKLVRENVCKILNVNRYAIPGSYLERKQRGYDWISIKMIIVARGEGRPS